MNNLLNKLCYISGHSAWDIFCISGDGIPKYMLDSDFKKYLKTERIPPYVRDFLEEGKQIIEDAPTCPFLYWGI
jgi:hypothetical protein